MRPCRQFLRRAFLLILSSNHCQSSSFLSSRLLENWHQKVCKRKQYQKEKCISYPKKTKRVSSPSNNEATIMASTSSFCPFDFVGSFSGSPCSMESWEWSHRWERQRRASWLLWHQRSQRSPKRSCNQTKFKLLDSNAVENIFLD